MASSFEESNCDSLLANEIIWEYQTNVDPLHATQSLEWIPFSKAQSSAIEEAHRRQLGEIFIDENCCIDLRLYTQTHIREPCREEAIRRRRRHLPPMISIDEASEDVSPLRERLSSPLGSIYSCSTIQDTIHSDPSFIHTWLLDSTKGKMKVTVDTIYPALVKGLIKEGEARRREAVLKILATLSAFEKEIHGKSSKEKMKQLEDCCATLYTSECYIYGAVNAALRDNDGSKVHTLGPFAYLLFNYIGRRFENHLSTFDRLQRVFRSNQSHSTILYRGDRYSEDTVEEYRRAAGDKSKYFKWLPFVSTSRIRKRAEKFSRGVLYIIEMRYYSFNQEQFKDLSNRSAYPNEEEVLLLPGVLFQVDKLEFNNETGLQEIYIKIKSSYIFKLK